VAVEDLIARLRVDNRPRFTSDLKAAGDSVRHVGDSSTKAAAGLDRADRSSRKAHGGFMSLRASSRGVSLGLGSILRASAGAAAGAAGIYGVGAAFQFAFGEADEAARVGAQTTAVLKSTGAAAGVTAGHVGNLANKISGYAGIDDEAIQSAENLLLTFRDVRNEAGKGNDIFDQTTKAAVDMGVALGTDSTSAAMMLGKALNDPAKGYSRLMRSGVSFNAQQIKQIKTMQAAGDQLGAQRIILREVNKEFAGSARAQAQPIDHLRVAWGNLAETAGTALLPAVGKVADALTGFITGMQQGTGAGGAFLRTVRDGTAWVRQHQAALLSVAGAVGTAVIAYKAFGVLQSVNRFVSAGIWLWRAYRSGLLIATAAQYGLNTALIANPIGIVVAAIAALAAGLIIAYKRSETFRNIVNGAFDAVKRAAGGVVAAVQSIIDKVKEAVAAIADSPLGKVAGAIGGAAGAIGGAAGDVLGALPFGATGGTFTGPGSWVTGEAGAELNTRMPGGAVRVQPLTNGQRAPVLAGGGDIVLHNVMTLNGQTVYEDVVRRARGDVARGGGG
jgi:hypothetical protein